MQEPFHRSSQAEDLEAPRAVHRFCRLAVCARWQGRNRQMACEMRGCWRWWSILDLEPWRHVAPHLP